MDKEEESQLLLTKARLAFEAGDFHHSLKLCKQAYKLNPCPKILKKVERIRNYIDQNALDVENGDQVVIASEEKRLQSTDEQQGLSHNKDSNHVSSDKLCDKLEKLQVTPRSSGKSSHQSPVLIQKSESENEETAALLMENARQLFQEGKYDQCLEILYEAQRISSSDKIQRKIDRLERHLKSASGGSADSIQSKDVISLGDDFHIPRHLYEKLYPYQKNGVNWLYDLHKKGPGGILADDMGLGKTVQVIAFLSGLFISTQSKCTVMIVMPVSVIMTWESELKRWSPALRVCTFHDTNRTNRLRTLATVQRNGGILLTTYGMVTSNFIELSTDINSDPQFFMSKTTKAENYRTGKEFLWTYLVLDEAHKVKNPSAKVTKALLHLSAKRRLMLTGTAVQNNLSELWSLYNITHSGRLLGTQRTFKLEYAKPIARAREKDATQAERFHGQLMAQSLRKLIDPYFLRRTKAEVLTSHKDGSPTPLPQDSQPYQTMDKMPRKTEVVVWLYLSAIQEDIYRSFLELDQVKELLLQRNKRSPLVQLVILKKLCDHPRLLSEEQCLNLNLETNGLVDRPYSKEFLPPASQLIKESGKFAFLNCLMRQFLVEHNSDNPNPPRALIFSQSLKFLNMAEKVILSVNDQLKQSCKKPHRILRLDGRLAKVEDRLQVIKRFEQDRSFTAMLLTTQVGGVGLTITSANRVIILDPSWNPATDAQAVDRAYRIGQRSDVIVYRLITCATVEEKIYRRQIFKESVIRQTTSTGQNKADADPYRYFTRQDLLELFSLGDPRLSATQKQLTELHAGSERWFDKALSSHLEFLTGSEMRNCVFGLSFHDLMFSREALADAQHHQDEIEAMRQQQVIMNRLVAAEQALAQESAQPGLVQSSVPGPTKVQPWFKPPVDKLFIPNALQPNRPMFNVPGLGRVPTASNPVSVPSGDDENDDESNEVDYVSSGSAESDHEVISIHDTADDTHLAQSLRQMSISQAVSPPQSPSSNRSNKENVNSPTYAHLGSLSTVDISPLEPRTGKHSAMHFYNSPMPMKTPLLNQTGHANFYRSTPVSSRHPVALDSPTVETANKGKPSLNAVQSPVRDGQCINEATRPDRGSNEDPGDSNPMDVIEMDVGTYLDDEDLAKTVHMQSMQELLAKSGLLQAAEEEEEVEEESQPGPDDSVHSSSAIVRDSISSTRSTDPVELSCGDIVEDTFGESDFVAQSLD